MAKQAKNLLVRPFVKWAGGKRQLLPEIKEHMPKHFNSYFEPFVGGGAVFLSQQLPNIVINDFNEELTNTYKIVRDSVDELIEFLSIHEKNNSSEYYYEVRSWDRNGQINKKTPVEKAARFIYLNKTGFNGLFRVNRQGQINVPFGRYKNPAIVNEEVLRAVSNYLKHNNVKILTGDYEEALKTVRKNDFVYLDPPYASLNDDKTSFVGYTFNGFGDKQQEHLRDVFKELDSRGAFVMLSNSSVPLIHELYKDFSETSIIVKANRSINSNGSGRNKVDEVLIMNYR
ncbi:DNA adenine methylase [Fructobacillus fructosus]|uniref:DNA adenine methylase n=1 Tax=Fructobacillus fructosus TaxID=1631 RepID=UPI0040340357